MISETKLFLRWFAPVVPKAARMLHRNTNEEYITVQPNQIYTHDGKHITLREDLIKIVAHELSLDRTVVLDLGKRLKSEIAPAVLRVLATGVSQGILLDEAVFLRLQEESGKYIGMQADTRAHGWFRTYNNCLVIEPVEDFTEVEKMGLLAAKGYLSPIRVYNNPNVVIVDASKSLKCFTGAYAGLYIDDLGIIDEIVNVVSHKDNPKIAAIKLGYAQIKDGKVYFGPNGDLNSDLCFKSIHTLREKMPLDKVGWNLAKTIDCGYYFLLILPLRCPTEYRDPRFILKPLEPAEYISGNDLTR